MDERNAARRPNLELVKDDFRTSSGILRAQAEETTTPALTITTGTLLEGKYLVGRIIGSGAVGIVFEAKNVELDETIAIKCLRPEMLVDKAMVARFAREAKAAAAIKSEYVATVYDVGTTEDGVPYIVMEYLDGKDLGTVVTESGTIGPRTAVEYALQVCEALAVAHSKGIVHRDIKPENLLLTERAGGMRIVKVLDFGISKTALTGSIFQHELPLVKTVNLMGTPLYMSPEQVRVSGSVDVRSDIWSLGMVIYEILTGQTAFDGQSITEICAAILESPPKPLALQRTDLPSGLVDVISKCLEKDVNKRYQNIAELALALMPFGPKRTRLNVERAVAVLRGAGQIDPSVRVTSTFPPSPSDFGETPIPRPASVPRFVPSSGVNAIVGSSRPPGSSSSIPSAGVTTEPAMPVAGSSSVASSVASTSDARESYGEQRKKPVGLIVGVALALLIGGGVLASTRMGVFQSKKPAASSESPRTEPITPAAKPQPTVDSTTTVAAAVGTPIATATIATTTPVVTTTAPGATNPKPATPVTTNVKPAWAPRPPPAKSGAVAKPRATGKPGDEPDLGY